MNCFGDCLDGRGKVVGASELQDMGENVLLMFTPEC